MAGTAARVVSVVAKWYHSDAMGADQRKSSTFRLDPDVVGLLDRREGDYASMSANAVVNVAVRRLLKGAPSDGEVQNIATSLAKRDPRILEALKNL